MNKTRQLFQCTVIDIKSGTYEHLSPKYKTLCMGKKSEVQFINEWLIQLQPLASPFKVDDSCAPMNHNKGTFTCSTTRIKPLFFLILYCKKISEKAADKFNPSIGYFPYLLTLLQWSRSFPSFSLPDMLCNPIKLIRRKGPHLRQDRSHRPFIKQFPSWGFPQQ